MVVPLSAQNTDIAKIEVWITNADRSALFEKQAAQVSFSSRNSGRGAAIVIDEGQELQSIDGFGFALTGGSAELMMKMTPIRPEKIDQ